MRMFEKKMVGLLVVSILLSLGAVALAGEEFEPYREPGVTAGYGTRVQYYIVPDGYPPYESRTRFLGTLEGTWYEMGVQYGERAGDLICNASDFLWMRLSKKYGPEHCREDLDRYAKAIDEFWPEMTNFMKGIAKGASPELAKSRYKGELSDFHSIVICNAFPDMLWGHPLPKYHKGKMTPLPKKTSLLIDPEEEQLSMCTGMALSGKSKLTPKGMLVSPTKNGETILTQNMDIGEFAPWAWNVAYVGIPSDPEANIYWTLCMAGKTGGNNGAVNEKGLALGSHAGGWRERPKEFSDPSDFGAGEHMGVVYTIAYADNAKEAIEFYTVGSPAYRARTGRKSVKHSSKYIYTIADPDEVAVVEPTAHSYAIRRPGDFSEAGNYVVCGNWNASEYYFDENNVRHPVPPPLKKRWYSQERYYAYDWHLKYHMGEMDVPMAKQMMAMNWRYDVDTGKKLILAKDGRSPIALEGRTPCRYRTIDKGGTMTSFIASVKKHGKTEIWWTQGRPCEWLGPWQHIDFAGFHR